MLCALEADAACEAPWQFPWVAQCVTWCSHFPLNVEVLRLAWAFCKDVSTYLALQKMLNPPSNTSEKWPGCTCLVHGNSSKLFMSPRPKIDIWSLIFLCISMITLKNTSLRPRSHKHKANWNHLNGNCKNFTIKSIIKIYHMKNF